MTRKPNGFTVIELVVSFSITLVVVLLLFQIVLSLKDLYVKDGLRTELLIKQGVMMQTIATNLYEHRITKASKCENADNCLTLTLDDNSVHTLTFNSSNGTIQYGDTVTKLVSGSNIGQMTVSKQTFEDVGTNKNNSILKIDIPITHDLVEGNFGISITYLYNSSYVQVEDLS